MSNNKNEYLQYQSEIKRWKNHEAIFLPKEEYALVMSELNTHLSDSDRNRKLLVKPIGNSYYVVLNNGFDEYIIIGKYPIVTNIEEQWEVEI